MDDGFTNLMMFSKLHIKQLNFVIQMNLFQHLNSHLNALIRKLILSGANIEQQLYRIMIFFSLQMIVGCFFM